MVASDKPEKCGDRGNPPQYASQIEAVCLRNCKLPTCEADARKDGQWRIPEQLLWHCFCRVLQVLRGGLEKAKQDMKL